MKKIKSISKWLLAAVVRRFWQMIAKSYFYYWMNIGIEIKFKRTFSNEGLSNHTWVIVSRHPRKSITWIWAVYFTKPNKWHKIYKSFWVMRQLPMWR